MEIHIKWSKGHILLSLTIIGMLFLALSCSKDSAEQPSYEPVVLEYVGIWEDNLDQSNLSVSFTVSNRQEEHLFSGNFYFNGDFIDNPNGSTGMSYEREDNNITNVRIDDTRASCGGLFLGTGLISNGDDIQLEVSGETCGGVRRAVITLSKTN